MKPLLSIRTCLAFLLAISATAACAQVKSVPASEVMQDPGKGYIVIVYPVEMQDPSLWVQVEIKTKYEEGDGIRKKSGYRYVPVITSLFDRNGQMAFAADEGKYRITLYSDPKLRVRVTASKTFKVQPGKVKTYTFPRKDISSSYEY